MRTNTSSVLSLALVLGLAAGCQGISPAPEGSPRVESEVEIRLGPSLYEALQDGKDGKALETIVTETILAQADLGLRLYPVPVGDYQPSHSRPDYVMRLQVDEFLPHVATENVKEAGETVGQMKKLERIECSATVTLWKRRANGPMLVVGKTQGNGLVHVRPKTEALPASASFELRDVRNADVPLQIRRKDVVEAVKEAIVAALRQLEEPVDRELGFVQG